MYCSICIYICLFFSLKTHALNLMNNEALNSECSELKNTFANYSAEFTLCAISNSRPITMCEKCIDSYLDVKQSYTNMSKVVDNDTTCLDQLINSDRLQIVYILYQNNIDLWTRAKCDECYSIDDNNSSHLSDDTEQFLSYYENFTQCINNTTAKANMCPTCMNEYVSLDTYYKSISNINEKISICMDLVDIMNTTWTFWSDNCCKYRKHNEYVFIGSTVAVLIITVAFYFILQFCKEKNAPTIIQQSRFFESLNIFKD